MEASRGEYLRAWPGVVLLVAFGFRRLYTSEDVMGHYGTLGDVGRARETLAIGGFWHECDTIATQCDVV